MNILSSYKTKLFLFGVIIATFSCTKKDVTQQTINSKAAVNNATTNDLAPWYFVLRGALR